MISNYCNFSSYNYYSISSVLHGHSFFNWIIGILFGLKGKRYPIQFQKIPNIRPDWTPKPGSCTAGVGNLRSAWTFDMACIRIFAAQFRVQNHVKTKLHDKQVLSRGEHGQDRIGYPAGYLRFFWNRIGFGYFFWPKLDNKTTGNGYLFDFYNEIYLRVIQDVTNDGGGVFFAILVFIFTQ